MIRVRGNWYSVPPGYIGATLTVKIDPLTKIAEVHDGLQVVRSFAVVTDEKNRRFYQKEHRVALLELWRKQFQTPKPKRRVITPPEVITRSPMEYERLFELSEVVQ
jgi:hypothetical protein